MAEDGKGSGMALPDLRSCRSSGMVLIIWYGRSGASVCRRRSRNGYPCISVPAYRRREVSAGCSEKLHGRLPGKYLRPQVRKGAAKRDTGRVEGNGAPEPERTPIQSGAVSQTAADTRAAGNVLLEEDEPSPEPLASGEAGAQTVSEAARSLGGGQPHGAGSCCGKKNRRAEKGRKRSFQPATRNSSVKNASVKRKAEEARDLKDECKDQKEKEVPKEVLIREILEEFLA